MCREVIVLAYGFGVGDCPACAFRIARISPTIRQQPTRNPYRLL